MRFREGRLFDETQPWLLVPTELQSTRDPDMAGRQLDYLGRHLRALLREGVLTREGEEPRGAARLWCTTGERRWRRVAAPPGVPDLPAPGGYTVLDAGAGALEDWPSGNRVSSWVRLLRSEGPEELLGRLVEGLWEFPEVSDEGFREALHAWALALWERKMPDAGALPPQSDLEKSQGVQEMTTLLEANLDKWRAGVLQQGIAQGRTEGMERGEARARADQRAQLRRLAGRKFGGRAAERLSALIEGESDPERLAEVGDWIIDCGTEAEFLARAGERG